MRTLDLHVHVSTRARIAMLIYGVVNAVLFGTGAVIVLALPGLQEQWKILLPAVIIMSFLLAVPIAWLIAPRLRARYWHDRDPTLFI